MSIIGVKGQPKRNFIGSLYDQQHHKQPGTFQLTNQHIGQSIHSKNCLATKVSLDPVDDYRIPLSKCQLLITVPRKRNENE